MTEIVRQGFPECEKCQQGLYNQSYRLQVKQSPETRPFLIHVHNDETFQSLLVYLCQEYPEIWKRGIIYYFYLDMGGIYHTIEDASWLKDKDTLIISEIANLEDLPKISLNAVHASLKDEVKLRPHQVEGVRRMIELENTYRGGILADEMGLGKTIQTLALVLRQQPVIHKHSCTLIVAPTQDVANQWAEEIRTKTAYGSLPYFIYQEDSTALINQPCFRVAITTYDRVRVEYKRNKLNLENGDMFLDNAPLFEVDWLRIVLDESHKVRGNTMVSDSVNELKGSFKWCLTGTPFQNDVSELLPIFKFLGIKVDELQKRNESYMTNLLKMHMIRRNKSILEPEMKILPLEEERILLEFTKPERALYDYLERLIVRQLEKMKETSSEYDISQVAAPAFILYLRLKQACGHYGVILDKFPDLIPLAESNDDADVLSDLQNNNEIQREKNYYDEENEFEQAMDILQSYYDQFGEFQEPIDLSELHKLRFMKYSTKVTWLVHFLREKLGANSSEKVVVVSQFVDVINKIGEALANARIPFQAYHGGLRPVVRKLALEKFRNDANTRVLVMSLKSGGVGLNLQRANRMVIMDRWWNPATMDQAIGRIHRMTQKKQTFVHTVIIKDSIEESLVDSILDKKNEMFQKIVEYQSDMDIDQSHIGVEEDDIGSNEEESYVDVDNGDTGSNEEESYVDVDNGDTGSNEEESYVNVEKGDIGTKEQSDNDAEEEADADGEESDDNDMIEDNDDNDMIEDNDNISL